MGGGRFEIQCFACGNGENASRCMDGEEAGTISIGDGVGDGIAITVVVVVGVAVAEVEDGGASIRIFSN